MLRKLTFAAAMLASVAAISPAAFAVDEHNVSVGVTAAGAPLGLHGVDPVGFINSGTPVEGDAKHTAVHDGVAYYFASAANMKTFRANPAAYLPQNGGYCTYGVSVGKKFDGDPNFAAIIDRRLYVFLNADILAAFDKDRAGALAKAEKKWTEIRSVPVEDL